MTNAQFEETMTSVDNISKSITRSTNYLLIACALAWLTLGLMVMVVY